LLVEEILEKAKDRGVQIHRVESATAADYAAAIGREKAIIWKGPAESSKYAPQRRPEDRSS
jgi:hypothetical protein